ncbi:hypothetical protein ACLBXM_00200 [Xanthobacteraceae bacterium A53D]
MAYRGFLPAALGLALAVTLWPADAGAEVRFGKNVRIGGHDASNQTFNSKRRGEYYIYSGKPANQGCSWRKNRDGSRTKVCHLQRKK